MPAVRALQEDRLSLRTDGEVESEERMQEKRLLVGRQERESFTSAARSKKLALLASQAIQAAGCSVNCITSLAPAVHLLFWSSTLCLQQLCL